MQLAYYIPVSRQIVKIAQVLKIILKCYSVYSLLARTNLVPCGMVQSGLIPVIPCGFITEGLLTLATTKYTDAEPLTKLNPYPIDLQ